MNTTSPVGERIWAIINHYRLNRNSFSVKLELSNNSGIVRILNDPDPSRGVSFELLQKIAQHFPEVSLRWFVLGEGEMLKDDKFPDPQLHYIKYYHDRGGEVTDLLRVYGYSDCDIAFDVFGDAMAPKFRQGDMILCKTVPFPGELIFGEAYLMISHDRPLLRYIKSETGEVLKLGAENPRYDESLIKISEVQSLYIIKGLVRREAF